MKFSCEKSDIINEIAVAQEIISSKNSLSILSNVYLRAEENTLVIKATDLKVYFETKINIDTKVPGEITVFCDRFFNILRSLPESEIFFELKEDNYLYITPVFKKINFKLRTISSDKYPSFQEISEDSYFNFPQSDIVDMISKTIFAVSNDETRYYMNGPYFEKVDDKLVMVATDGRRLSLVSKKLPKSDIDMNGVIVPVKILTLVKKLSSGEGDLKLAVTDKSIFFKIEGKNISSGLIEGQFPNYQRVIPTEHKYKVIIDRETLNEALKRVSVFAEQKSRKILFSFYNNALSISSEDVEVGEAREELECKYDGDEITLAVNYLYIMEPLREIDTKEISIEFTEENKAITIKPIPENDYLNIVMPMQIS